MKTGSDPFGVCLHRSAFIDSPVIVNRSRPTGTETRSGVGSQAIEFDVNHRAACNADNTKDSIVKFLEPEHERILSTHWLNIDNSHPPFPHFARNKFRRQGSSNALCFKEISLQVNRSSSCDGRIEHPNAAESLHKLLPRRRRHSDSSWYNNIDEKGIGDRFEDSWVCKIPKVPYRGLKEPILVNRNNEKACKESQNTSTHMKRNNRLTYRIKKGSEPTKFCLPRSSIIQARAKPCISPLTVSTIIKKRGVEEEEGIRCTLRFKKVCPGDENERAVLCARRKADIGENSSRQGVLKSTPSSFDTCSE